MADSYECGCFVVNPNDDPVVLLGTRFMLGEISDAELERAMDELDRTRQQRELPRGLDPVVGCSAVTRERYDEIKRAMAR